MAHKKYNNNTLFFNVTLTSKCCSPPSPSACHSPLSLSRFLLAADCSKNLIFEEVKSKERTLRDVPNTCVHTLYATVPICECVYSCILYHSCTHRRNNIIHLQRAVNSDCDFGTLRCPQYFVAIDPFQFSYPFPFPFPMSVEIS